MPMLRRFLAMMLFCGGQLLMQRTLYAQDGSKTVVNDVVKHWERLKNLSLAVAQAIPDKAYSSKVPLSGSDPNVAGPYELGSSALANVLSCSMALGTRAPDRFQSAISNPMDSSKAGVIESLTTAYDYCIDGLQRLNDAELFATTPHGFKGHPATRFDVFWDASGHAAHALGEADLYLRLKGLTPPETGPSFEF